MVPLRMLVFGADDEGQTEDHANIDILTKNGQIMREKYANELMDIADPSNKIGEF